MSITIKGNTALASKLRAEYLEACKNAYKPLRINRVRKHSVKQVEKPAIKVEVVKPHPNAKREAKIRFMASLLEKSIEGRVVRAPQYKRSDLYKKAMMVANYRGVPNKAKMSFLDILALNKDLDSKMLSENLWKLAKQVSLIREADIIPRIKERLLKQVIRELNFSWAYFNKRMDKAISDSLVYMWGEGVRGYSRAQVALLLKGVF